MSMSRHSVRLIPVTALAFASLSNANAADTASMYPQWLYGWYEAGPSFVEPAELRNFPGGELTDDNEVKFDPGFHFGIAIGRELTPYIRVEVESGFNYNAMSSMAGADSNDANFYRVPILANLVLQYPNKTGIVPVIGAGAGAQWLVLDAQNVSLGFTTLDEQSEGWTFSYQVYGGVNYHFREDMSLGVFYHYNVADSPSWDFESVDGNFKLNSLRTHSVSLTFGWRF